MLRRGYNYTDGSDGLGHLDTGLFFVAFVKDPRTHYVPMQMAMAKQDTLAVEYLQHTGSALAAVPPGVMAGQTITAAAQKQVLSRPSILIPVLSLAATAAWGASLAVGHTTTFDAGVQRLALSGHVLAMVLGFGSVIVVDWVGFLWLIGKRGLHDTSRLESAVAPLIWVGLAGLLLTGAFIHPDVTIPATQLKMYCALGLMLNGISLVPVMR